MPKMKTHRGTAKRIHITGSGKLLRNKSLRNHILEKKSPKRKRNFRQSSEVTAADHKVIARQLGLR